MRYQILANLVTFSLLSACSPFKSKPHHVYPEPVAPIAKVRKVENKDNPLPPEEKCPTRNDLSLDPARQIQRRTLDVKMEKQRVVRKDCQGRVTSDKMEKVTVPKQEILLKPVGWWTGGVITAVHNRTTCDGPGLDLERRILAILTGVGIVDGLADKVRSAAGFPSARFTVDTSPTLNSMHVLKNADNYIDYEFSKCAEVENGKCKDLKPVEKGTLILTVRYTENLDIGGLKEIQEPCSPPPGN